MHRLFIALLVGCSLVATGAFAAEPRPWPHDASEFQPDPSVRWGHLDNGLRYVIKENAIPPERVSLRMYVQAGSLMEAENQRGLAHFLEHMAFNGSENIGAGELVEYLQRLGMAFGPDTNAYTTFDRTVYMLELPENDPELLDKGLQVLRETADRLLLTEEEIDAERGVIISEKRVRESASYRVTEAAWEFGLPDSILPKRFPIGTEEVIKNASRERFVEFYEGYYTPARTTIIVVGAVDPDNIESLIKKDFATFENPEQPLPDPDLGAVKDLGLRAGYHFEKNVPVRVSIGSIEPTQRKPFTRERVRRELTLQLANAIISRRLATLSEQPDAGFLTGYASTWEMFDFARQSSIMLITESEDWQKPLRIADEEIRRALEHGFTAAELREQKVNIMSDAEQAVKSATTRESSDLADAIIGSLANNEVYMTPEAELAFLEDVLPKITPEDCHLALKAVWDLDNASVFIGGEVEIDGGENAILTTYRQSRKSDVEAPQEVEVEPFAYTSFGEPGSVAAKETIPDLNIIQVRFDNNVRLNLRPSKLEQEVIRVSVLAGGGLLELPKDDPALAMLFDYAYTDGGLKAHSQDELRRILAGKQVGVGASVQNDGFVFQGSTNREDFDLQMRLMTAYLTAPGYRPEAQQRFIQYLKPVYQNVRHTSNGVMSNEVARLLRGGDPRFGVPPEEEARRMTLEKLRAWVQEPLTKGYLEVNIAGDVDVETAIEVVGKTFGALPERAAERPDYAKARQVHFPKDRDQRTFRYTTEIPKAIGAVYWPTTDTSDRSLVRRLFVMAQALDDRLRLAIREEKGATYSPVAYNTSSSTFPDFGFAAAYVDVDPGRTDEYIGMIKDIAHTLAEEGITQDEFERALKPIQNQWEKALEENSVWLNLVLMRSSFEPARLDVPRNLLVDARTMTRDEVNALAKRYLQRDAALEVAIIPEAKEEE